MHVIYHVLNALPCPARAAPDTLLPAMPLSAWLGALFDAAATFARAGCRCRCGPPPRARAHALCSLRRLACCAAGLRQHGAGGLAAADPRRATGGGPARIAYLIFLPPRARPCAPPTGRRGGPGMGTGTEPRPRHRGRTAGCTRGAGPIVHNTITITINPHRHHNYPRLPRSVFHPVESPKGRVMPLGSFAQPAGVLRQRPRLLSQSVCQSIQSARVPGG
jgi:hypothetical protein